MEEIVKMISRKRESKAKIGIFAVAHATYKDQFEGLYDNLMNYHADFRKIVEKSGAEVVDFGMRDSSERAYEALSEM